MELRDNYSADMDDVRTIEAEIASTEDLLAQVEAEYDHRLVALGRNGMRSVTGALRDKLDALAAERAEIKARWA